MEKLSNLSKSIVPVSLSRYVVLFTASDRVSFASLAKSTWRPKKMYSEVSSDVKNHPSVECQLQKEQEHGRKRKENRLQRSMCWLRHATGSACFDRDDQQIGLKCLITAHRDIIISTACQRCFLFSSVPHGHKMLSHLLICKHYG